MRDAGFCNMLLKFIDLVKVIEYIEIKNFKRGELFSDSVKSECIRVDVIK